MPLSIMSLNKETSPSNLCLQRLPAEKTDNPNICLAEIQEGDLLKNKDPSADSQDNPIKGNNGKISEVDKIDLINESLLSQSLEVKKMEKKFEKYFSQLEERLSHLSDKMSLLEKKLKENESIWGQQKNLRRKAVKDPFKCFFDDDYTPSDFFRQGEARKNTSKISAQNR
jgi:hypothetical protein